ncbi:SPW repeat domain-containing protein [Flavobacterium ginsengiterrae]|uniref:SPW repeat protein n=1 Tax=Flavobacterium ginsengiterrae TaxID=871695 RepID=A0ABP7G539_9FLAO
MKPIDTRTHGCMDYIMGIFLTASPSIFELNYNGIESTIFYILGPAAILYSLLTNYELGFIRLIPMKLHLILDFISGVILASSPWLFGFSQTVYGPHVILGIIEIGAALLTSCKPMRRVV